MVKDIGFFIIKLLGLAAVLFFVHQYTEDQFFLGELYFPLWQVYLFNVVLVLGVFVILRYFSLKQPDKIFQVFLILTLIKMGLVIVFLLPLFLKKSDHVLLEILNFFIPYFSLLILEVKGLYAFLKKS